MAKNMQQWDGSTKYATMGWQRICSNGVAALNMQRLDGEVSQSRAQSALNKHNDAIWLPKHYLSQQRKEVRGGRREIDFLLSVFKIP